HLRDDDRLTDWKYSRDLLHLTQWLEDATGEPRHEAARRWDRLTPVFGVDVANAYRHGMTRLWRFTEPKGYQRQPGGGLTITWTSLLSFDGLGIEANEGGVEWVSQLD